MVGSAQREGRSIRKAENHCLSVSGVGSYRTVHTDGGRCVGLIRDAWAHSWEPAEAGLEHRLSGLSVYPWGFAVLQMWNGASRQCSQTRRDHRRWKGVFGKES